MKFSEMLYRTLSDHEYSDAAGRIVYEDNHLLIVNKMAGEIVQADKTEDETITDLYKSFIAMRDGKPGSVFLGVPHRLDRPVSGIVILSKTSKALARLNEMFRKGDIHKYYWALVCAPPPQDEGKLSGYIYRIESRNKSYMCRPGALRKDAKTAELEYRLLCATERYWLVEVKLLTGRHHQIRVQFSAIGCSLVGDNKYGKVVNQTSNNLALWAGRLEFIHPVTKEKMVFACPPMLDKKPWSNFFMEKYFLR